MTYTMLLTLLQAHVYVKKTQSKQDVKQPRKPKKASTVTVIYRGKSVAKAVVMDGHVLHGKQIPVGYIKISVTEMLGHDAVPLQFKGPFDDDDDVLVTGLFTAWPLIDLSW